VSFETINLIQRAFLIYYRNGSIQAQSFAIVTDSFNLGLPIIFHCHRSFWWKSLYGYDSSVTLDDDATLNDTTRNDATHDDLPTQTTTTRPTLNVNTDWKA
jgi:hypothetical protein